MKSLSSLLKPQFCIGFIGALLLTPILYIVEFVWGDMSLLGSSIWLEAVTAIWCSLLFGGVFVLTGLVAFPVLKFLQRRDIVRDICRDILWKPSLIATRGVLPLPYLWVGGALIGVAVMAWLIPVREHNFLDLRVGLAIGALVGYLGFRIVAYLVDVRAAYLERSGLVKIK